MYGPAVRCKRVSSSWRWAVLHQCIQPLGAAHCSGPSWKSGAPAISLAHRPHWAMWVTSARRLRSESDLLGATLLHDDRARAEQGIDWASWLSAAGVATSPAESVRFDSASLAIEAAAAEQGVALARSSLVGDDLASGRLVQPFSGRLTVNGGYFIAHLRIIEEQPKVIAFREWLFAEASLGRRAFRKAREFVRQ